MHQYLLEKVPGTELPLTVRQFGGGAANLTYLLNFSSSNVNYEYVLRRPPLGPVAKSSHDMAREYKVLSVLYQNFSYAPRAYHFCPDPEIIGSNFFIMERKKGIVIRTKYPEKFRTSPDLPHKISEALVDRLVELHRVDYKSLDLEDLGHPEGFISRQIEGWYQRWLKAKTDDSDEMNKVYHWLQDNLPDSNQTSLIHNDYKLDNMMLNSTEPEKIEAIFDWDMCTIGDPLSDLGALMAYWSEETDPMYLKVISTMPVDIPGFYTRQEIIKRYEQTSGVSIKNISFYHVLGVFRLAVIVAQIYIRFVRKQTQDKRFAGLGHVIPPLIHRAFELTNQ